MLVVSPDIKRRKNILQNLVLLDADLSSVNTLRPRQNGRHFADDIFNCILLNENVWIMITNSLKFVPKGPINNIPALVQIMAWCRPGDKPLSEPMLVSLPTHICVTRPQWVDFHRCYHPLKWIQHYKWVVRGVCISIYILYFSSIDIYFLNQYLVLYDIISIHNTCNHCPVQRGL